MPRLLRCDACGSPAPACARAAPGYVGYPGCRGYPGRDPVVLGEVLVAVLERLFLGEPSEGARSGGQLDARPGGSARCRRCGLSAVWHRTLRGRWVLMEPGEWPTGTVPAGKRWRIAGDGTAVNLCSTNPSDTCRITHWEVCPVGGRPGGRPGGWAAGRLG